MGPRGGALQDVLHNNMGGYGLEETIAHDYCVSLLCSWDLKIIITKAFTI